MTRPDLAALRRNAEAATKAEDAVIAASGQHREDLWTANHDAQRVFHDAADPTTILALLDEVEALRAQSVEDEPDALTIAYMKGFSDGKHSAPPAPSSAGLIEAARKGLEALERCNAALQHGDFSNGITDPTGTIDEGNVVVSGIIRQTAFAIAALRAALEEAK